jgi:DNA gyrase subunit A
MTDETGRTEPLLIEDEMKDSYLSYAMSVIVSRALPDVRDGLKPSQRRVLVAMQDLKLGPRSSHRKCAKIAGDTTGNYHPHGDQVVYPTLVRLAQNFVMRYPLIDGQGNFGSIDGDPPAAMRYTEARMTAAASEMMTDIEKDTVDVVPNYDNTMTEPVILPGAFPNLLCNGSSGIAVGMATSIPPHNLNEIADSVLFVLANPEATIEELCGIVKGPDFPTGGLICGRKGIRDAYHTGRGQLTVRARTTVEEMKNGRKQVVVLEIPYQLNKTMLIEAIAAAVKDDRIPSVSDIRDESDKDGMRLVIELKKGEDDAVALNQLFKHSQLESTFSIINIALVDGRPRTLNLKQMIESYISHRREVIRRRTQFLLKKAQDRLHIVEGLKIAVDNIDEVVRTIREAADVEEAKTRLIARFGLSEIQANEILKMQLKALTGLEREKLEAEHQELLREIADLLDILANTQRVDALIREDLEDQRKKFGDPRRTEITEALTEFEDADLIPDETMAVTVSHLGYVKRLSLDTYRVQGRGGVGITGAGSADEDFLEHLFVAQNHDFILFLTDRGRLHWLKVYRIPELSRQSKGRAIVNLIQLEKDEKVTSMIPVRAFDRGYLFMATRFGTVKKTAMAAFKRPKRGGIIAIDLEDGDALVGVSVVNDDDEVLLATTSGYAIRFAAAAVRAMGRNARGVRGIKPREGDHVIDLVVVDKSAEVLSVGEKGLGKRTPFDEYRITNRGGLGIINMRVSDKTGGVVAVKAVRSGHDLMIMTEGGMVVRIDSDTISSVGRSTQGVKLISLKTSDRVVAVTPVVRDDSEGEAPRADLVATGDQGDDSNGAAEPDDATPDPLDPPGADPSNGAP